MSAEKAATIIVMAIWLFWISLCAGGIYCVIKYGPTYIGKAINTINQEIEGTQ